VQQTPGAKHPGIRSWFRREAVSLGEVAVHTFAVVLGFLLALTIDDWKKERDTAANVAEALAAVHTELEGNRIGLRLHREHLTAMSGLLRADKTVGLRPCSAYPSWRGTGGVLLLDAAYQTAIMTQTFAHIEFSRAQTIARAYGAQRMSQEYLGKIDDLVLRGQQLPAADCGGIIAELANLEGQVDQIYIKALKASAPK
jgi:hypothetical protein